MTLYRLIGESAPVIKKTDHLTPDHPDRSFPPNRRYRDAPWLRLAVFVVVFAAAFMMYYSGHMAVVGPGALAPTSLAGPLGQLVAAVVAYVVLAFVMESRVWPSELAPARSLGLLKGMLVGAMLVCLTIGVLAVFGVYRVAGVNGAYNPWVDLLTLGLVAGVSEEIILRGVLFRLVEEGLGTWGAVAVSAAIFGVLHITNKDSSVWGTVAIALEGGVLLAAVYTVTRSLWWVIGAHLAWNVVQGPVFGSAVSGTGNAGGWLVADWHGPDLLTGGTFGIEGSVVTVVIGTLTGVALLVYAQRQGIMVAPMWVRRRLAEEQKQREQKKQAKQAKKSKSAKGPKPQG